MCYNAPMQILNKKGPGLAPKKGGMGGGKKGGPILPGFFGKGSIFSNIINIVLILLIIVSLYSMISGNGKKAENIPISQLATDISAGLVSKIDVSGI